MFLFFSTPKTFSLQTDSVAEEPPNILYETLESEDSCSDRMRKRLERAKRVCRALQIEREMPPELNNCQINTVHNAMICVPHKAGKYHNKS